MPSSIGLLKSLVFAFIIGFSANAVGKIYNNLTKFDFWARRITGMMFILIGIYLSWQFLL